MAADDKTTPPDPKPQDAPDGPEKGAQDPQLGDEQGTPDPTTPDGGDVDPAAVKKALGLKVAADGELPPAEEHDPDFTLYRRAEQDNAGDAQVPPDQQRVHAPFDSASFLDVATPEYDGGPLFTDAERQAASEGDSAGEFGPEADDQADGPTDDKEKDS